MGIPRLSQDIAPFAATIGLGQRPPATDTDVIDKVVIDGPSLAYLVYDRVLRWQASAALAAGPKLSKSYLSIHPPYSVVADVFLRFLNDLKSTRVTVLRIYFDGALPVSKELTRWSRLEQARQQLDKCRRGHPKLPKLKCWCPEKQAIDAHSILWHPKGPSFAAAAQLPSAPFIVPAVIERLLSQPQWSDIVEIVPGESDPYCAVLAVRHGAAILSNDSDLLLYDLGEQTCLINLNSLEVYADTSIVETLKGLCFWPRDVTRGLGVTDLKEFAFQRSLDSQVTSRVVSERTRTFHASSLASHTAYHDFRDGFLTTSLASHSQDVRKEILRIFDPRLAEYICALADHRQTHIYLPILFEDPERDSAWSYGTEIRQLAYSIYQFASRGSVQDGKNPHITEHMRRAAAIKEVPVSCLSEVILTNRIENFTKIHQSFFDDDQNVIRQNVLLGYYAFAACLIQIRKAESAKSSLAELTELLTQTKTVAAHPSWVDIHILACIHAVLYSIRLLKQLITAALGHPLSEGVRKQLEPVANLLQHLPTLEGLFYNQCSLWHQLEQVPHSLRYRMMTRVQEVSAEAVRVHPLMNDNDSDAIVTHRPQSTINLVESPAGQAVKRKKKRRRGPDDSGTKETLQRGILPDGQAGAFSPNRFAPLD